MPSGRLDEARDYAFADLALALRKRGGLTQRELASLLHVSGQSIHTWESGLSYPGTTHLKELIALYLDRGALASGREEQEAAAMWASVRERAPRRVQPFDPAWFAALQGAPVRSAPAAPDPLAEAGPAPRQDWGEAPTAPVLHGRAEELAALANWVREGSCRVVQVLGTGGVGKTTLAAQLSYELASVFAVIYWRSLRNALPVDEWLAGAIAALTAGQAVAPEGFDDRLALLLGLLRARPALLVLDNLEAVLEPGTPEVRYRTGLEGYRTVLERLADGAHRGCLLLTSREQPLRADGRAIRALHLEGLGVEDGRALLGSRALAGDDGAWRTLVARYGGNPLALAVVGETIRGVFGGNIAAFLAQDAAVFGGIRQLLDAQVRRLSGSERAILGWLAARREPAGFAALVDGLGPGVARGDVVEALEALQRRSLVEWGLGGTFTLQPAVLEYAVAHAPTWAPAASGLAPQPTAAGTPDRPPTNLPQARTSFVGRAAELATLAQALDPATRTGSRLLTLTGVAGCGKTRLALAVADMVRDAYGDGAWLVGLAALPASPGAEPTPVAAAALGALGLHEQPGQEPLDTLVAHLQPRHLLLVLDNCEHVVAACAALAARLLGACPMVRILTTSQQALGYAGETAWRVAPLEVPPPVEGAATPGAVQLLEQSDAVQLFVQRAHAVLPGFELRAETTANVAAICRRLDGLPLAIELAAARLNVLSVAEILARLDDRFRLLRRGRRGATDRHQTLQATLDWSYGLLDPAAQAVLRRLAVFSGGWEVTAAEVVCAGEAVAAVDVLDVLDELLERSLLYVQQAEGLPRYGMLETVRQYGAQQLEWAGEAGAVRDRHLRWCATLAEQAAPALLGSVQALWLARLKREHDNLRAALQWALDRNLDTLGLRTAGSLGKFWLRGGHQREGRRWLGALLALAPHGEDAEGLAVRATALETAAGLAEDAHEFAQATALYVESDGLKRTLGQAEHSAAMLMNAAVGARAGGEYARATALLEECLDQYRELGNRASPLDDGLGLSLSFAFRFTHLALVLRERGAYARAVALCQECLALARELGDAEGVGQALLSLADVARDQGDTARMHAFGEESLALFRDLGQPYGVGFSLNNLAQAAYLDGDLARAASRAAESASIFRDMQAGPSLAEVLITLGRVRGAQGETAAALANLSEALALATPKGPRLVVAAALEERGVQAVRQGHERHGIHLLGAVARMRQAMGTPVRPADRPTIEGALAAARASLGDPTFIDVWAAGQALSEEQLVQAAAMPEDDAAR